MPFHTVRCLNCRKTAKGLRVCDLSALHSYTKGLTGDEGLAFFDYGDINTKALRADFKEKVNALNIDRDMKDKIIEEKKLVFKMNNEIASEVKLSVEGFRRILKFVLIVILMIVALVIVAKTVL